MTEAEIADALRALVQAGSGDAYASMSISIYRDGQAAAPYVYLKPAGADATHTIFGRGATFAAALADARQQLLAKASDIRADTVRRMALAIIDITARLGLCSDATLRAQDFAQADIDALGADACAEAERMAASGPFVIVATPQSNAA